MREFPLFGRQPKEVYRSRHMREEYRYVLLDVLAAHQPWIYLEYPLSLGGRGYLGKNIQCFCKAHGRFGTRMLVDMPGRRSFVGPTSWARTSIVPLEGSMTGLISITLALYRAPPRSAQTTSSILASASQFLRSAAVLRVRARAGSRSAVGWRSCSWARSWPWRTRKPGSA